MSSTTNDKITYFLYARKSSDSEDRQVQSIDDQIKRLEELAGTSGIEIKEILKESKTAKMPYCRPIFDNMVSRINKGEANGILCWEMNRLFRNPVDQGTIHWMLQQGVLQSIRTIDHQYLPDDNVLLLNVIGGMANQFIIDLRKSSRRGMIGKAERGWLPSCPPLGYLNDKLEHIIIEDDKKFPLVRKMWDMMLTGKYNPTNIREIANRDWGFTTPKRKRSGGKEISNSVIYKLFTNIFYTGMFEWAGTVYTGNHKPMVTLEEFDKVQVILGKRGKPRKRVHEFAYTGIMTCGECGGMITATEKEKLIRTTGKIKTYVYYHCTHKKSGGQCSQTEHITLKELENQIDSKLERFTILPQFRDWALDYLRQRYDKEVEDRNRIFETQQYARAKAQRELDNLIRMSYRELISEEAFIAESKILKERIALLDEQLRNTESRAAKWIELTQRTFHFATNARHAFNAGTLIEKREIFMALGRNFTLKDKKVLIEANEWFLPIEKAYPELEAEFKRLELIKYPSKEARNAAFGSLLLRWGATVEATRTAYEKRNDITISIPLLEKNVSGYK